MPTTFFLTPLSGEEMASYKSPDEIPDVGYKIALEAFGQSLLQMWPLATVEMDVDGLEWCLEDEDGTISGTVRNSIIATVMPGSARHIVEFINWYRGFMPEDQTLYVFHLGQSDGLILHGNESIMDVDLKVF
jgi:hypothetical protein